MKHFLAETLLRRCPYSCLPTSDTAQVAKRCHHGRLANLCCDTGVARKHIAIFEADWVRATPVSQHKFAKRPWWQRFATWAVSLVGKQL